MVKRARTPGRRYASGAMRLMTLEYPLARPAVLGNDLDDPLPMQRRLTRHKIAAGFLRIDVASGQISALRCVAMWLHYNVAPVKRAASFGAGNIPN